MIKTVEEYDRYYTRDTQLQAGAQCLYDQCEKCTLFAIWSEKHTYQL